MKRESELTPGPHEIEVTVHATVVVPDAYPDGYDVEWTVDDAINAAIEHGEVIRWTVDGR